MYWPKLSLEPIYGHKFFLAKTYPFKGYCLSIGDENYGHDTFLANLIFWRENGRCHQAHLMGPGPQTPTKKLAHLENHCLENVF